MKLAVTYLLLGSLITILIFGFNTPILPEFQIDYSVPGSWPEFMTGIATFLSTIVALFAIFYTNQAESKRRIRDKRFDKFYENRSTIVQIEHELIPLRVNMSRNLSALKDATENTNPNQVRLILRFYRPTLSTGLSLKLLNLDVINKYSEVYSLVETVNSDIEYMSGMINALRNKETFDESLLQSYVTMLPYLLEKCEEADHKSLELLSLCKIVLADKDGVYLQTYLKQGGQIEYSIQNSHLKKKSEDIEKEENMPYRDNEPKPKFFSPFMDVKRVVMPVSPPYFR